MQVSSISPNFQGRRDNVDALIAMDDNSVRKLAYLKTSAKIDHDKNRKVTNCLFYNAPLVAGLATAVLSKGENTKIFSKEVTGVASRMAKGLKVAAFWTAGLLAVDLLGALKNKVAQKSPEVRNFDREHPLLSMGTMLAAGLGTLALVCKGAGALSKVKAPKFMQNGTEKVANFLNESKLMVKAKNGYKNLLAKTPSALKEIGATALDWAPTTLLLGGLLHSVASTSAENREFAKNYVELKEKQANITRARIRELAVQNDFLMQEAQNRKDMEILNDNLADLPDEVVESVEDLNAEEV